MDADVPAGGAQFLQQVAADNSLNLGGAPRKGLVAALGAHGKRGEAFGLNFLPRSAADGVELAVGVAGGRAVNRPGQRVVGHAEDPPDAGDCFFGPSAFAQLDEQAVAWPRHALDGDAFERAAQGDGQLAEKKTTVPALEPELVVMDDNDRLQHGRSVPGGLRSDAASIAAASADVETQVLEHELPEGDIAGRNSELSSW